MTTCRCDPGSWTEAPEPICGAYVAGSDAGFCSECWHDRACHASWEEEIRRDEREKVLTEIKMRLGL